MVLNSSRAAAAAPSRFGHVSTALFTACFALCLLVVFAPKCCCSYGFRWRAWHVFSAASGCSRCCCQHEPCRHDPLDPRDLPALQMMACMFVTYKLLGRLFGSVGPVGRLPFEPPPFLQKVTHRGLSGADPRECSAVRRPLRRLLPAGRADRTSADRCTPTLPCFGLHTRCATKAPSPLRRTLLLTGWVLTMQPLSHSGLLHSPPGRLSAGFHLCAVSG